MTDLAKGKFEFYKLANEHQITAIMYVLQCILAMNYREITT